MEARLQHVSRRGLVGGSLGSFHNEGELLIAADDRLADLLEWPELAQETTLLRRQSRQVGSIGDSS